MSRYLGLALLKTPLFLSMNKRSKFAIATLGFLTGFFLCEFIISFFLSEKLGK